MDLIADLLELNTNEHLVSAALELGALMVPAVSKAEEALTVGQLPSIRPKTLRTLRSTIRAGADPLGFLFCLVNSRDERRSKGAVYTPMVIVEAMMRWSKRNAKPDRIVDAGTGSGRFLSVVGRAFPKASLVGFECDPLPALIARANLSALGFAKRSSVLLGDFRSSELANIQGQTLHIGNPPYVRHHLIEPKWKTWLSTVAHEFGHAASGLAGLHAYFFLATARHLKPDDLGLFITSAEWLDVNYGSLIRDLFLDQLGGIELHVIEPEAIPFPGTATTAVITGFRAGGRSDSIGIRRIETLADLGSLVPERKVNRERFETSSRWTPLTRSIRTRRSDFVELGEICRVHRGQVTGANAVWIENDLSQNLPISVLFPTITRAKELFGTGLALTDLNHLRRVIDIPPDLTLFDDEDRDKISGYLRFARKAGANSGYVATHRRAWWSVGLKSPAPILATYMARRAPAFVRNLVSARHINIAHGLYPRDELDDRVLNRLAEFLSRGVSTTHGRTYSGGLVKFEPREMERLPVPSLQLLRENVSLEDLLN